MAVSATRPGAIGGNSPLSSREPQQREYFGPEAKELFAGVPAIELAVLLGKPDDHTARMLRATRPFKFVDTPAFKEARATFNNDKSLSPVAREKLKVGLRKSAWNVQEAAWRQDRLEATQWLKTLRLYVAARDWLLPYDAAVRVAFVKKLEGQVAKVSRHEIVSASKEEKQWRTVNRRENRKAAKRKRSQYGWRGASHGRTAYLTPGADGSYDPVATATAEFAMLTAEQASGQANHGVYIIGDQVGAPRKLNPATMSEERRKSEALIAMLNGEAKKFKQLRRKNGSND